MAAMSERLAIGEESWSALFDFLDPERPGRIGSDRDQQAQAKYLEISRRLACFFAGRGCCDADDLAVETMLRVTAKCREIAGAVSGDPLGYFFGVARNVHHEWLRQSAREASLREDLGHEWQRVPPLDVRTWKGQEAVHRCLDRCLARLTHRARSLIVRYYSEERTAKIADHRLLADEFGKSANALRIEVHRIRRTLRQCVLGCAHPESVGPGPAAGAGG
jgi:RNA polymerase sigma factor (sigma-70 family)